ncbi:MAG: fructose-bisphosphate aldolase [Euryarchaeota archaeon]|nr:fructose-bisphosphate aldolase [Euryarchaeota archaeon]|tara:strand:- start:25781 stop:26578 length:798 start_codon:yes stop_codon:yes gene_type:complete
MDKSDRIDTLLPNGRGVWIPIDHGASDYPVEGLIDTEATIRSLIAAGVDVILAQKGVVSHYGHLCEGSKTNMVVHLSVSTRHAGPDASNKVLVGNADEVIARGGMGVSCQVNMGSPNEATMVERMGSVSRDAFMHGLPMFGMVYARGEHLSVMPSDTTNANAHAVRLAFELGCDAAKTTWTGDKESFQKVTSAVPIPVLVAGGPSSGNSREILSMVRMALDAGASGICMGRQVFGHPEIEAIARALVMLVHQNASVEQALEACKL